MKRIFTLTALLCLFMMMGINAAVAQSFSAKWSYGTNGGTTPTISPSGIFEASDPVLGSSMGYKNGKPSSASQTLGDIEVWQYSTTVSPADAINNDYTDDRTIKYTLTPKSGTTLTPSQISFYACKIATGDEVKIKVVASVGSKSVTLNNGSSSDIALDRDNGSNFKYDLGVSGLTVDNSNPLVITVYVKGKGFRAGETDSNGKNIKAKNLGFGEVTISGTYKAGSTSIKSSSEMTTSTSAPTTWNFSDVKSSKWTKTVSALNTYTSEWKKAESSDEWRPTTVCSDREYNLELINGLIFNTITSDGLCLDNENQWVSMEKGSSITIPGLKSGNCVRIKGTNVQGITTPDNAALISSGGNEYLFKVTSDGNTKFVFPSSLTTWGVWIQSIEVLASAPVNKNASRQLSVEKLDYKSGVNSKNGALDRTTRGLSLKFNGGDGIKFNGDSYGINWRYKNASVTVGLDPDAIKSSGSDAKITRVVFSTNTASKDINLNNISMDADGDITLADSYTGPNAGSGAFIVFTPKNPVKSLTATETDNCNIYLTNFFVEYEYSNGKDLPDYPTTVMPSENDIVIVALEGKSSASQSLNLPKTSVGNLGGTHNNKSVWNYEITSSDGTKNPDGLKIASVSDGILTVNATAVGIYTVTATYTPTKDNYFTWGATDDNKETFTVRVIDKAISSGEWIFDATLNNGDGIGHNQKFSSDLWSETTVTDILDSKKTYKAYDLTNGINDDAKPLTTDGSKVVSHTEGLDFRSTLDESLVVVPDHSLRMDENSSIVIRNIKPSNDEGTTYILIDAQPTDGHGGFEVDKKMPISFYNEELSSATNRQVFMLKVKSNKDVTALDVTLWPSDGMEIYKIEVTQKKVPTFTVEVSGDDLSSYTATDENKVTKTIYKVNNGKPFKVKFKTNETDLKGKLMVYALGDLVDGSAVEEAVASGKAGTATFNATGKNGGGAVFVAKFTPDPSETTYTYGYATVIVDIGDKTMYRVGFGQSANVGDVITSVEGIKMYIDGWEGAEDAPAEYRSDGTADKWTKARKEAYIETFPGYDYTFSANENSADETQTQYINKNAADYRNEPYWYDENNIPNNPYMMPVFGGFLKFVPSVNGTLKVYIHQNGAVCSIKHKDGTQTITPYIIHMRSYYIGDETGKLYTDADNVTAVTKARLATLWNTKGKNMKNLLGTIPTNNPDQEDDTDYVTDMPQYQADIDFFKTAIGDRDVPQDEVQKVYCTNGGWVMFNEGATEYTIPNVKAGKTYYVFTNKTKLGFYGFRFTPDENVTEVTITPSAEDSTSYTLTKSSDPAAGSSVAYKVDQSFKRVLNAGMWNTLCLPFSLNEDQTKAALPGGFEILDLHSIVGNKLTFKKHYYQMIVAGRPYLVFVPGTLGETYTMKMPTDYVSAGDKALRAPIDVRDSTSTYKWVGTYHQMTLPQNAYFVAKNPDAEGHTVMKQNQSGKSWTKGYRAYLVAASGTTPIKSMSLDLDYDGVDENVTTGIDDIIADLTDPQTTGMVYNLGGQLISRNGLQSLPKGIYIMNGKKYVVK